MIERCNSDIPGAGKGVKVTKGHIFKDSVVALYPGAEHIYTNSHYQLHSSLTTFMSADVLKSQGLK